MFSWHCEHRQNTSTAVTHRDHLCLWHHDSAVPGLLAELWHCTHTGTIHIGSITNGSLRVRQWSGPASWCGVGVLPISSCLVWHLWVLAQSFFLGPSSWLFPHAFCRSWDPELRFILGISFLICFTQELIPGYVLYVQRLSLLFTPCLSDSWSCPFSIFLLNAAKEPALAINSSLLEKDMATHSSILA